MATIAVFQTADDQAVWEAEVVGQWSIASLSFNSRHWVVAGGSAGRAFVFDENGSLVVSVEGRIESIRAVGWVDDDIFLICGRDVDTGPQP